MDQCNRTTDSELAPRERNQQVQQTGNPRRPGRHAGHTHHQGQQLLR